MLAKEKRTFKKPAALGWSLYRDGNPVPTSPLADDIATAPSRPIACTLSLTDPEFMSTKLGVNLAINQHFALFSAGRSTSMPCS